MQAHLVKDDERNRIRPRLLDESDMRVENAGNEENRHFVWTHIKVWTLVAG
jgi:WD40 repeat protein